VSLKQPSDRLYVAVTRRVNERGSAKLTREEKMENDKSRSINPIQFSV